MSKVILAIENNKKEIISNKSIEWRYLLTSGSINANLELPSSNNFKLVSSDI